MKVRFWVLGGIAHIVIGCFAFQSFADNQTNTAKKLRIGFLLATMNEERYVKDRDYFLEAAKNHGAEVEFGACDDKVDVQVSKAETLITKGIDVLVIQPVNSETASSVVALAKKEAIPVIAYDRIIKNADIDAYVTQDSFRVGALQAEEAVKSTNKKGNYIILMGEAGHSVAEEITRGVMSVLSKYPDIKIVLKQSHPGWSTSLALATVENTLTRYKNNIQAILANNDGMAIGAVKALEEQRLAGKVFVAGADADLAAIKELVKKRQSMTVLKGIKPLAAAAVKAATQLASKQALSDVAGQVANGKKNVPVINTPVDKVTNDNLKAMVIDSGFHTAEAIYGKRRG